MLFRSTVLGIKGGRTIYDYWPKFKSVAVNVSIDGLWKIYEYIRSGGNFKEVVENVNAIKQFPNVSRVVGAFTVQANNILQLPKVIEYFLNDLEIVFYSHRVQYPRVLSAQVLPKPLKDDVIRQLNDMYTKIDSYKLVKKHPILKKITQQQITDNINFLEAKDLSEYWQDCIAFNKTLDSRRNQGPFDVINPEFANYV